MKNIMRLKVNHITHILCFVLGCSFTLLILSYQLKDRGNDVFVKEEFDIMVVILTSPENFEQRSAIRETWASDFDDRSQYIFVVGTLDIDQFSYKILNNEQTAHGDILMLPVQDSYSTLTRKLLAAFIHITTTYKFKFLLKLDDDTFVNVKKLAKAIDSVDSSSLIHWGYFNGRAPVFKKGKWKEDNWFLCDRYLPYALGGGYILTFPAVQYLVANAHLFSLYKSEDVSVGAWLAPLNMTRIHDTRFDTGHKSRGCQNSLLVSHKQSPEMMRTLHTALTQSGKPCEVETETSKPYEYDWAVPPSHCCSKLALSHQQPLSILYPKNKNALDHYKLS